MVAHVVEDVFKFHTSLLIYWGGLQPAIVKPPDTLMTWPVT